jgi:hypothetical protein
MKIAAASLNTLLLSIADFGLLNILDKPYREQAKSRLASFADAILLLR